VAIAQDDGGDPKVVDRWLFGRALLELEIHWGGSCGQLRQSSTDTSAGRMEGTSSRLGSYAWVCGGAMVDSVQHLTTPQAVGMATQFAREQEPAKNRRREPPPGCDEHLRYGHSDSPQDAQGPTARDFVEVKFVGRGSPILEKIRAALPWPLGSRASSFWYGAS
jgi:hypothetical protein